VPKFRRATLPNSKVIMAHLLHFKPIFDLSLKKVVRGHYSFIVVRGPPSPVGSALGDSLAHVKIWGRSTP